ncbi:MAG: hypothetical protein HY042_01195 [Spirochaetia bacterium]|nr:hypothetical protein [Spirochaetia bacterium]
MRTVQVTGWLFLLSFGTVFGTAMLRESQLAAIQNDLNQRGQYTFVHLTRAEQVRGYYRDHFFYTYKGIFHEKKFEVTEEVNAAYFHLHSEGKIVQAAAHVDGTGALHTLLRDNEIPFGKQLLAVRLAAAGGAGAGLVLVAVSMLLLRFRTHARSDSTR